MLSLRRKDVYRILMQLQSDSFSDMFTVYLLKTPCSTFSLYMKFDFLSG